jgi:hypothetical protein
VNDAAGLAEVLQQTPPRSAELVSRLTLDGWSLATLAERYGIDAPAARRLVLRAARDFEAALRRAHAPPLPDDVERPLADALAEALEAPGPGPAAAAEPVQPLVQALAALVAQRGEVRRHLAEAEQRAAASPARRRETWLRRLAIITVLGVSAWLYWREHRADAPAVQPPPAAEADR